MLLALPLLLAVLPLLLPSLLLLLPSLLLLLPLLLLVPPGSDRVRDTLAGPAHGERGQDHRQPARGVAPAHPRLRGHADSGGARSVGACHAAAQHRPQHGEGSRDEGTEVSGVPWGVT